MLEKIEKLNIETSKLRSDGTYGMFVLEPLQSGYGNTLGNSLRRVLLSSLPGVAATSVKIDGVQQRNKVGCLRLGKLRFCFGNPIKQESDFLLDVPDNGIGCSDPAVELAFLGADTFLLHCPDGCALMNGGKKLHALTLIASVVDTNVKPLFRKLAIA